MTIIPPFFLNSVVAIGIKKEGESKPSLWVGTGFLVGRPERDNEYSIYVITNKHVVIGKNEVYLRFNNDSGTCTKDYSINLTDNDGNLKYTPHPEENIDICALKINGSALVKDKSEHDFYALDKHAITLKEMQETGLCEGSLVYALGFPMNLVSENKKAPICRLGCISRISDVFIDKKCSQYLIDAQAYPGNSGGPVINCPEIQSIKGTPRNSNANLIGILNSYIPYRETLISTQTNEPRSIMTENSGLTLVYPVDYIKEVVELERERVSKLA